MKINYSPNGGELNPKKNQVNHAENDFNSCNFAEVLNQACVKQANDSQSDFLAGLSANFTERLAHYERTATTEEHSAYVEMMKNYAQKEQ
jgi:hypothetical protein